MVRRYLLVPALVISGVLCLSLADAWGRGFGGAGGGHFGGGGGFGGAHPGGGGFGGAHFGGGGGFGGFGGAHPGGAGGFGGAHFGGAHPGGAEGFGGAHFGGGGGLGGFGGAHPGGAGGFGGAHLGGAGGVGGFDGAHPDGFGGAAGSGWGGNRFNALSRGQLNSFLGLPADEGFHGHGSVGVGLGNVGVGSAVGVGGGRAGMGVGGVGRPAVGVGGVGAGLGPVSASARYATATTVRARYDHWGLYGHDWYGRYPGAWCAAAWGPGMAWRTCAWRDAALYCGFGAVQPIYYDYGTNIVYQDAGVSVDGDNVGTGEQYFDQAANLASTGALAEAPADGDWLPLGVFALTKADDAKSDVSIQLAVNKQGILRGNATDTVKNTNQEVRGSVDKQTQRVAFTVGDDSQTVVETGLYNLTKDEAPCLIHLGKDRTEQWLLVRLQPPANATAPGN